MAMPKILNIFTAAGEAKKTLGAKFNNFTASNEVKKALEEKYQERMKIYGYIGMEAYDLYKNNKISFPAAEMHFEKMREVEKAIADLEAQKQRIENEKRSGNICSCGQSLSGHDRFCPKCGKPIEKNGFICTCGQAVKTDMLFCPKCGKSMQELQRGAVLSKAGMGSVPAGSPAPQQKYRECICGAKVLEGQNMCMECGRMIGNMTK